MFVVVLFFFLIIRRPPRSTQSRSSAASDVYKRQTYDLVTEDGRFGVGITAPGIRISAKALWEDTARLPEVEIKKPDSILARETISSMQAGLVYGQIGQTEYIINQVKKETGITDLKVVATGGLGRIIADETDTIDIYDSALTLDGLRILYEKNCSGK